MNTKMDANPRFLSSPACAAELCCPGYRWALFCRSKPGETVIKPDILL